MFRYAQIDTETGMVVSDSYLSGEVEADNMISISEGFDLTNKKYVNGEWVEYTPEPIEPEPTTDEILADIQVNTDYLVCLAEINNE